jgi:hypothetical protein
MDWDGPSQEGTSRRPVLAGTSVPSFVGIGDPSLSLLPLPPFLTSLAVAHNCPLHPCYLSCCVTSILSTYTYALFDFSCLGHEFDIL